MSHMLRIVKAISAKDIRDTILLLRPKLLAVAVRAERKGLIASFVQRDNG